jgi:hypothetical protein
MFLKDGFMHKLGEGPVNYDWNLRYFVLNRNFNRIIIISYRLRKGAYLLWKQGGLGAARDNIIG